MCIRDRQSAAGGGDGYGVSDRLETETGRFRYHPDRYRPGGYGRNNDHKPGEKLHRLPGFEAGVSFLVPGMGGVCAPDDADEMDTNCSV